MPKGQPLINWTAENDARLILTILAVENIHPNCENVAAAFGGAANAMAISNRLTRLRKKAAEEGLVPNGGAAPAPPKNRKGNGAGRKGDGGKKGGILSEGTEGQPSASDRGRFDPPPTTGKATGQGSKVLTGRVIKARGCGKKKAKRSDAISDDVGVEGEGEGGVDGAEGGNGDEGEEGVDVFIKSEEAE